MKITLERHQSRTAQGRVLVDGVPLPVRTFSYSGQAGEPWIVAITLSPDEFEIVDKPLEQRPDRV